MKTLLILVIGFLAALIASIQLFGTILKKNEFKANDGTRTIDDAQKFVEIFDGSSLTNWDGDTTYWRVENGTLTGEVTENNLLNHNSFIIWQGGEPANFELKGEYRISENGNSGINYRSERLPDIPFALKGYQADFDGQNLYTGQNYEERKRTTLAYISQKTIVYDCSDSGATYNLSDKVSNNAWSCVTVKKSLGDSDSLKKNIKPNDWNSFRLVIKGNRLLHYVNGVLMSDVTDNDVVNRTQKGLIGMQVHVGPAMKVQFRNLQLKEL
jgi:hypothetical protein